MTCVVTTMSMLSIGGMRRRKRRCSQVAKTLSRVDADDAYGPYELISVNDPVTFTRRPRGTEVNAVVGPTRRPWWHRRERRGGTDAKAVVAPMQPPCWYQRKRCDGTDINA